MMEGLVLFVVFPSPALSSVCSIASDLSRGCQKGNLFLPTSEKQFGYYSATSCCISVCAAVKVHIKISQVFLTFLQSAAL